MNLKLGLEEEWMGLLLIECQEGREGGNQDWPWVSDLNSGDVCNDEA